MVCVAYCVSTCAYELVVLPVVPVQTCKAQVAVMTASARWLSLGECYSMHVHSLVLHVLLGPLQGRQCSGLLLRVRPS